MGFPILANQYIYLAATACLFSFIAPSTTSLMINLQVKLPGRKKWDSDRVKSAVQAIRNKKMGGFKAAKICNAPQQLEKVTLKN